MSSSLQKSMSMPERSNGTRERAPLTLQPRGARSKAANNGCPVDIDSNTFPDTSSMQKVTTPRRTRALPAVPHTARAYTVSSTQSAHRNIRPLPYCPPLNPQSSLSPTSSSDSSSSDSSSSPLFPSFPSSPLSTSPLSSPSSSSTPLMPIPSTPLSPTLSSTSLTPALSTPLSPTLSTPITPTLSTPLSPTVSTPLSPIRFAPRTWAGVDNSSLDIVAQPKIRRSDCTSDSEDDEDADALAVKRKNRSIRYRWKSIWRQPTPDPQKKWVTETKKGQRRTVKDYSNVLNILRKL